MYIYIYIYGRFRWRRTGRGYCPTGRSRTRPASRARERLRVVGRLYSFSSRALGVATPVAQLAPVIGAEALPEQAIARVNPLELHGE